MATNPAASQTPIVSRDRVIDMIRTEIRTVVMVERRLTVEQISERSGVSLRTVRTYMANDPTEVREPCLSAALSIAFVLGKRAVSAIVGLIGYAASPLDGEDELRPMQLVADMMAPLSTIATAAADGRIDHTEMPACTQAADKIIAAILPLSSARASTV